MGETSGEVSCWGTKHARRRASLCSLIQVGLLCCGKPILRISCWFSFLFASPCRSSLRLVSAGVPRVPAVAFMRGAERLACDARAKTHNGAAINNQAHSMGEGGSAAGLGPVPTPSGAALCGDGDAAVSGEAGSPAHTGAAAGSHRHSAGVRSAASGQGGSPAPSGAGRERFCV